MSRIISIVLAALIAMLSVQAVAQPQTPGIDRRIAVAKDRVYDGVRLGYLTRAESDRLHREIADVEAMVRRARRDGVANYWERQDIRDALVRVERDIDRLTYNRKRR
jgi:hypothetical protein